MPYPFAYADATRVFHDVLEAVQQETALGTTNQAFTVLEGVLRTFRRRFVVEPDFDAVLATLPEGAARFWSGR